MSIFKIFKQVIHCDGKYDTSILTTINITIYRNNAWHPGKHLSGIPKYQRMH